MATDPLTSNPDQLLDRPLAEQTGVDCLTQRIQELERQVQQQQQCQHLIGQIIQAIQNSQKLSQTQTLAVTGLVQTLQASRGLLLMFKYADPRHRHRQGSLGSTRATVAAEFWAEVNSTSDSTEATLRQEVDWAIGAADRQPLTFLASECSLCQPILMGEPELVMADCNSVDLFSPPATLLQVKALPALLMLPLASQGITLGCLVLQQDQPRDWSTEEIAWVRLIAAQLSTAIIQTRSFQQVQALVQERTAQLERSLEVQAKLYEKTRQQVEQLRKLNEEREEFLSTVSHELLTPLTSMSLAIRMLRQAELDGNRRAKYLEILEQQCLQETRLINDLLALRKLETATAQIQAQKLDLPQFVRDLIQPLETHWRDKDLKLNLRFPPRSPTFYSDGDSLHRILLELLTNAKKYSEPGTTIELDFDFDGEVVARQVTLAIRNVGAGIAPDELPHIFEKFRRGRGVTQQAVPGTGLGLALVKSLVEHLEGTIVATSSPIDSSIWKTCFTITLPQAAEGYVQAIA